MSQTKFYPVAVPNLSGNEKKYVMDCVDTTWISSNGKYVTQFEQAYSQWMGVKHALSCCNGTVALHLPLLALGIGPGDEVLVPTLTYIATANAVRYCGAAHPLLSLILRYFSFFVKGKNKFTVLTFLYFFLCFFFWLYIRHHGKQMGAYYHYDSMLPFLY